MGERTSYTPGTFSWTDLTTTDPDGAKEFYGALFGWQANDLPVGEGLVYSMMQLDGKRVAAISAQPEQQRGAGVPPIWNSYISVESAERTLERAAQLGATVHAPAFDVMDAGRMGVVQDPQGAFFMLWEPKDNIGAQLVNGPGLLSWNELATPDMEASASFYSELFEWKTQPFEGSEMPYITVQTKDGRGNGGIRPVMPPDAPPHWLVYFGADDIDATLGKATQLGGTALVKATDIGVGKIAVIQDPQGAVFALFAGQFED
jgi:predicted enzyme related to lactoylglutathione lyase